MSSMDAPDETPPGRRWCRRSYSQAFRPRLVVVVLAAAAGLSALGCSGLASDLAGSCRQARPEGLATDDLVGTYSGEQAGSITLRADGTFEASNLAWDEGLVPVSMPPTPFTGVGRDVPMTESVSYMTGSGTWQLQDRTEWQSDLSLRFDGGASWDIIDVSGSTTEPWLYYLFGDPDSCDIRKLTMTP